MSSQFPPQQLQYDTQGQVVMTASHQRVKDKQREWEGFVKILRQTKQLEGFIKDLGEKTELLEDGGEGVSRSSYVYLLCLLYCILQPLQR